MRIHLYNRNSLSQRKLLLNKKELKKLKKSSRCWINNNSIKVIY